MTLEEARLTLQENFGLLSFQYPGRITEALKVAIEALSQHSLPSNLYEAAEAYVKDYGYTEDDYKRERIIAEEHFKAGAEWQKTQMMEGAMEAEVADFNWELYNRCVECGLTDRDKVKIIILKDDDQR